MSDSEPDNPVAHAAADSAGREDAEASTWAVSICFWAALIVAAMSYAAVALAPKFSMWSEARQEYRNNGSQLAALEKEVDYLERVKTALETDPEFVRRLTQTTSAQQADAETAELIPVSGNLLFGESDSRSSVLEQESGQETRSRSGIVTAVATSGRVRSGLLAFSACLTIFAFTFLNDAGAGLVSLTGQLIRSAAMLPVSRYVSSQQAATHDDSVDA